MAAHPERDRGATQSVLRAECFGLNKQPLARLVRAFFLENAMSEKEIVAAIEELLGKWQQLTDQIKAMRPHLSEGEIAKIVGIMLLASLKSTP